MQGQEVIDADTEEKLHALAASKQVGRGNTLRLPWWSYPALGAAAGVGVAAPFVLAREARAVTDRTVGRRCMAVIVLRV